MFGEHQVVFLRSDGLRSRMARKNKKNTEESSASEDPEAGSSNLSEIIDGVATGRIGTESYDSVNSLSTFSSSPTSVDPISTTNFETSAIGTEGGTSTESFEPRTKTGNRSYHPPRQFHGISLVFFLNILMISIWIDTLRLERYKKQTCHGRPCPRAGPGRNQKVFEYISARLKPKFKFF